MYQVTLSRTKFRPHLLENDHVVPATREKACFIAYKHGRVRRSRVGTPPNSYQERVGCNFGGVKNPKGWLYFVPLFLCDWALTSFGIPLCHPVTSGCLLVAFNLQRCELSSTMLIRGTALIHFPVRMETYVTIIMLTCCLSTCALVYSVHVWLLWKIRVIDPTWS